MNTKKIDFVDNATTKEAGVYAVKYGWAFTKGVFREINSFVHKMPWMCLFMVAISSMIASFVCVSEARKERDMACKKQVMLQEQVEQLSCFVEVQKGNAK